MNASLYRVRHVGLQPGLCDPFGVHASLFFVENEALSDAHGQEAKVVDEALEEVVGESVRLGLIGWVEQLVDSGVVCLFEESVEYSGLAEA